MPNLAGKNAFPSIFHFTSRVLSYVSTETGGIYCVRNGHQSDYSCARIKLKKTSSDEYFQFLGQQNKCLQMNNNCT